ncbi:hypothetical protein R6Q57_021369 [Mikania cordata]
MPWRTSHNVIDCGIFLMRHMETYMGEEEKEWKCGFIPEDLKGQQQFKLDDLRRKYAAKILLNDVNEVKSYVVEDMKKYLDPPPTEKRKLQKNAKQRIYKKVTKHLF